MAIARASKPAEQEAAKERQAAQDFGRGVTVGNLPTVAGRANDKVASYVGIARRTLEKAEAVVEAAECEPERYGELDETPRQPPYYMVL